jgi:hypothetical protein
MRLPDDFPHTRHEQYVVALPEAIRLRFEHLEAAGVHHRLQLYYVAMRDRALDALIEDGWAWEDIERALRRRGLPPAFCPPTLDER